MNYSNSTALDEYFEYNLNFLNIKMFRFFDNVRTYVLETEYLNINQSCEHWFHCN